MSAIAELIGTPFAFNTLLDRQLAYFLLDDPETLTSLGIVDGTWLDFHSGKLTEYSLAKRAHDYDRLRGYIAEIKEWNSAELDPQEQISYDMAIETFGHILDYEKFPWLGANGDLYQVNQIGGVQNSILTFMQFQHKVSNGLTARNYVSRLVAIGVKLDAVEKDVERQASLGVVPPDFILDKTIAGMLTFLAKPPEQNALVTAFVTRLAKVEDVDADEQAQLKAEAIAAVRDNIYPAYRRIMDELRKLREHATHDAGVWRLPGGDAYYAARLRDMTTTNLTPDQIHAYGLSEVARITGEMDAILRAQGMTEGTVGSRMDALRVDPRFALQNNDADRARVLATYRSDVARAMALAPRYFSRLPKAPVEVVAVPDFAQEGSAGAYYEQPALDGSRPGRVFVNLRDVAEWPIWGIHSTAFHEGVPGHHFQIALAQELDGLPLLRRVRAVIVRRGLGAVCREPRPRHGPLSERSLRRSRTLARRTFPRRAPGRRHRDACQALVPRTGDHLYARHHRQRREGRGGRDRTLRGVAGAGLRLQNRHEVDHGHAGSRTGRTGLALRHPGLPRGGPGKRRASPGYFRTQHGPLDRRAESGTTATGGPLTAGCRIAGLVSVKAGARLGLRLVGLGVQGMRYSALAAAALCVATLVCASPSRAGDGQLAYFQSGNIFHSGLRGAHTIALTFDDGLERQHPGCLGGAAHLQHQGDLLHRRRDGARTSGNPSPDRGRGASFG